MVFSRKLNFFSVFNAFFAKTLDKTGRLLYNNLPLGVYWFRRRGDAEEKQVAGPAASKTQNSINANNSYAAPAALAA